MEVGDVLQNISKRQKKITEIIEVNRNLVTDVGNLTAWDPDSIVLPKSGKEREDYFRQLARDDTQYFLNSLYDMKDQMDTIDGETVLKLPDGKTGLPRAKPVPQPKPPTRWEQFARQKGIKSKSDKRRDKLQFDDKAKEWVPRYGYKKAKQEQDKDWLIELPDNADPNVDYFAKKSEEKRERVAKNKYQQLRNVERSTRYQARR